MNMPAEVLIGGERDNWYYIVSLNDKEIAWFYDRAVAEKLCDELNYKYTKERMLNNVG